MEKLALLLAGVLQFTSCSTHDEASIKRATDKITQSLINMADKCNAVRGNVSRSDITFCKGILNPETVSIKEIRVSLMDKSIVCGRISGESFTGEKINDVFIVDGDNSAIGDENDRAGYKPLRWGRDTTANKYEIYCPIIDKTTAKPIR